jgi:cytochrome c peroxidase
MKPSPVAVVLAAWLSMLLVPGCTQETPRPAAPSPAGLSHLLTDAELQNVGEKIFFDQDLSTPSGQACAACHSPAVGWTGPDEELNKKGSVYSGAIHTRFGNRKPNSSAYATLTPAFHAVQEGKTVRFVGGNFWDGRATGWKLGNPAADQAEGPFLNPVEQNNPDPRSVVRKIGESAYAEEFRGVVRRIWGIPDLFGFVKSDHAYGIVALAIAAYEHSSRVNQFSSKYDMFLTGKVALSADEQKGLALFEGKARCANCHPNRPGPAGEPPLFTDFTYDNIGVPRNPDNPWYAMPKEFNPEGARWIDPGLAEFLNTLPQYAMFAAENLGKHRVPTLRNVDLRPTPAFVKAFGHNGYFKSLEMIVHFYNTRDLLPAADRVKEAKPGVNCWPAPEVVANINKEELGDLKLTTEEEAQIVAFMRTLSDGYKRQ